MSALTNYDPQTLYDAIIIGGGPAGLTAALYLARARYRVLVVEKQHFGGQITITHEVVNYPGIETISGADLTEAMYRQAESFGAEFLSAQAQRLQLDGDVKTVCTERGDYHCLGVLLATGAHPRTVGFAGEEEYKGRGVAYCATCDGGFFAGKDVFVIGGGYAAAEESVFLTRFARKVTILIRRDDFSCAASVAEQAKNHPKIAVLTNTVVEQVSGKNGLNYIRYKNTKTDEVTEFRAAEGETFGVFVFAGYEPATALVKDLVELNEYGYIVTDRSQRTDVPGVYAAGDVCIKPLRQVITAAADGAMAAAELEKYTAAMREKTGLRPVLPDRKERPEPKKETARGSSHGLFTDQMTEQLNMVFGKMERKLLLKLYLNDSPASAELESYIGALAALGDRLLVQIEDRQADAELAPFVEICHADGRQTGLAFHGVPGGHEFTSFVLGLYNAAGPGQKLDEDIRAKIRAIDKKVDIKLLITLSCTMCPDLVVAAQHIAALSSFVTCQVYDVSLFPALAEEYHVMSVPCMVINGEQVSFGKKNIGQVLELIEQA